jgi:hypothetical protein
MTALDTLARQLNLAAAARRRRRRRASSGLVLVAVAAAALAALVLVDRGAAPVSDERSVTNNPAPGFIAVDPDKIVYVRAITVHLDRVNGKQERTRTVLEEWHRGRETHRLVRGFNADGSTIALDHVISADGTMRQINEEGEYRVFRPTDNEDAKQVIASEQAGFLAGFQSRIRRGALDPSPGIEFNGRPAYRYRVTDETQGSTPSGPEQTYFVDRATRKPLGSSSVMTFGRERVSEARQTIERLEQLEPTEEHLAKLRTLTLERRG